MIISKSVMIFLPLLHSVRGFRHFSNYWNDIKLSSPRENIYLLCENIEEPRNYANILTEGPFVSDTGELFCHINVKFDNDGSIEKRDFITELGTYKDTGIFPSISKINQVIDNDDNVYERVDEFKFVFNMEDYEIALKTRERLLTQQLSDNDNYSVRQENINTDDISTQNTMVSFSPLLLNKISEAQQNDTSSNVIKLQLTSEEFKNLVTKSTTISSVSQVDYNRTSPSSSSSPYIQEPDDVDNIEMQHNDLSNTVKQYPKLKLTLEKYPGEFLNDITGSLIIFSMCSVIFPLLDITVDILTTIVTYIDTFVVKFILPKQYKHLTSALYMLFVLLLTFITNIAKQYDIDIWKIIYLKLRYVIGPKIYTKPKPFRRFRIFH